MDELLALASCQPTALSLEDMYRYAPKRTNRSAALSSLGERPYVDVDRLRNAQFLRRELPIRLAQRAVDLLTLPHGLNRTREVQSVANTYLQYLQRLKDFPVPTNAEGEREFTRLLQDLVLDRHSIPMAIARGLRSLKDERQAPGRSQENSDALYRRQLEMEGGVDLLDDDTAAGEEARWDEECCGAIQKDCDPVKEVRRTVKRVERLCRESYGIAPEIRVVESKRDADVPFTYVPHHLRYMLAELLKNSCRATVKSYLSGTNTQKEDHTKHRDDPAGAYTTRPSLPPISVVVTKGAEDVTIKARKGQSHEEKYDFGKDEFTGGHIRGFGLPLARIYARDTASTRTSTFPVLGVACENLPQRVVRSPGNLDSSAAGSDSILDGDGYYEPEPSDGDLAADLRNEDFYEDSNVRGFDSEGMRSTSTLDTLNERAL
ncbi:hypothetical protein ACHAXT_001175 [Thalassiosira profunda]